MNTDFRLLANNCMFHTVWTGQKKGLFDPLGPFCCSKELGVVIQLSFQLVMHKHAFNLKWPLVKTWCVLQVSQRALHILLLKMTK